MKTVLITGCSSGIGHALARAFAKNGYFVYATARKIEALQSIEAPNVTTTALNVTDSEERAAIAELIQAQHGQLDILVNNAGYAAIGPLVEMPADELHHQFDTNVFAQGNCTKKTIVPTLQRGNTAKDAPASCFDGKSIWPEAAMSFWNRTNLIF